MSKIENHDIQGELERLSESLGFTSDFTGTATLYGQDPVILSPHKLGEASAIGQLLVGIGGAAIWKYRTGKNTNISIDIIDALHYLHPTHFVQQQGRSMNINAEFVELNGYFKCKDGYYVIIVAGPPYMNLLTGYLNFFNCGNNRKAIAEKIAEYDSLDLENKLNELGLPCCRVLSEEEWLNHPQGKLLSTKPVVNITKLADSAPYAFSDHPQYPLEGIKVVDFAHVLAGPRTAQTLAEYGADVIHVSTPAYPDTLEQHLGVDMGKRCTYLDLNQSDDLEAMLKLIVESDVFITSYSDNVNTKFGLTPEKLSQINPNLIYVNVSAYGLEGPWRGRPGFDPNGQGATGFSLREGGQGTPKLSPVSYLADLMTNYFAVSGVLSALLKRTKEGGSYLIDVSLARSAMWVQSLGLIDKKDYEVQPAKDTYPYELEVVDTCFGKLGHLKKAVQYDNLQLKILDYIEPYGASLPTWEKN